MRKSSLLATAALMTGLVISGPGKAAPVMRTITVEPGRTTTAYSFVNMRGKICLDPDATVRVWWIYSGTTYPTRVIDGPTCLEFANKVNGELRVHNPSAEPVTVTLSENAKEAHLAETVDGLFGSAAGGPSSEVNKAHRAVKHFLKRINPFG